MAHKDIVLYVVTNSVNGKNYVGITSQKYVSDRWKKHLYCARKGVDTYLYRAVRKHGSDSFEKQIVATCSTASEAKRLERFWIGMLRSNSREFGYNTTFGGEAPRHSEETKKKISDLQRANPRPTEFYREIAKKYTPEMRSARVKEAWASGKFLSVYGDNHWTRRTGYSPKSIAAMSESRWKNR